VSRPAKAPIAQLDRVLPSEGRGRTFESCWVRHFFQWLSPRRSPSRISRSHLCHSKGVNMASIRKRRDKWQVQIRQLGHQSLTRSFLNRKDAETWARQTEVSLDRGALISRDDKLKRLTVGDLLTRYGNEISPKKRGVAVELVRLTAMLTGKLADISLHELTPAILALHRDERLKAVAASTVRREFSILRHLFQVARRDWGVGLQGNPVELVRLPPSPRSRERRLSDSDFESLKAALVKTRNRLIEPALLFAIETGLRRGELLAIRWQHLDLDKRLLLVPLTKTGEPRTIPLTVAAMDVMKTLSKPEGEDRVFPLSPNALRIAWKRLTRRAKIENLHFHDLRHEAISRFFELGLTVPEVALISGHRDPRMLFRYTHIRPAHVGKRLDDLITIQQQKTGT
jgi:integrase